MNDLQLQLTSDDYEAPPVSHPPIGRLLINDGKIGQKDLLHALGLQERIDAPLGDIMVSEGLIEKQDVLGALAKQARTEGADLELSPPDPAMAQKLPAALSMKYGVVPWREDRRALYVATSSPADFSKLRRAMGPAGARLFPVIVDENQIQAHQSKLYGGELAQKASVRVSLHESCRSWGATNSRRLTLALAGLGAIGAGLLLSMQWTITIGVIWAVLTLAMTTTLKTICLLSGLRGRARRAPLMAPAERFRMPRVSVLVPLLKEKEIAAQLITRLSQLTYPKSLLNVMLVLEEGDTLTRETIARTPLPDWMSVIEVPEAGNLTTKPRALNYALDFCKGSIVGVWDAEDWPEADQIEKVVTRFNQAPDNVVCLQGVLDYYNSRSNWLSRCFTIEYAMWWRIVMPGIARLGLVVPLGGTTLFFKRDVLEELGGWDAHNVTEDADLGVRLARHGYATELIPTVTHEEATSHPWPWVRQRSRWLKGFLVTYCVHMRRPAALMRDLGFRRFLGVQTLFLASFSQFATAPLLWSFWLTLLGMTHPVEVTLGATVLTGLIGFFILAEVINLIIGLVAVSGKGHRHLIPFVPTMIFYFVLGALASYKALWELVRVPFYWDKTQHGVSRRIDPAPTAERRSQASS